MRFPAVAILVAACATGPRPATPPGAPVEAPPADPAATVVETTFDTTWYVTSRARRDGRDGRAAPAVADSLEYGFVVTRFRGRVGPGSDGRLLEELDARPVDSTRLDRAEFLARVRATDSAAAPLGEGAVMYVHGFGTSFRRSIAQGAEIAHRGGHRGPFIVFSWPAHDLLVTWPSFSAKVSRAYRDDSATAAESHDAFREALGDARAAVRPRTLVVVGHSLGAQLVSEALARPSAVRDSLAADPLRALVLFAADIPAARFRDSLAAALEAVAGRRVVYASTEDRMLRISRLINGSDRLGQAEPATAMRADGVEIVDVTDGLRVNGTIRKLFEPRHAMRLAASALHDFFGVVRSRPPECRALLGLAARLDDGTWRLSDRAPPRDPDGACGATPRAPGD